ncbi:MAG: hypothetical protein ACKOXT_00295 [Actinomycetota bacterium]
MSAKLIIVKALLLAALPFLFFGLIDPLEGGISLIFAGLIYFAAFLIKKSWPAKILWIPFLSAVVIGAITLAVAISNLSFTPEPSDLKPGIMIGNWLYRLAVLATLAGGIHAVIREFQKPR